MATTNEEFQKRDKRIQELSSLYNKYYRENNLSGFPPELLSELTMLNNMVMWGVPYNAGMAKAAADRAQSAAITAAQNSGGLGGLGSFLASIDPSTAISRELTNLYQPVEKAITAGVEDVSKALSTDDAKKAMGLAAAYFLPGVGAQLGQALVTQGIITGAAIPYATAIGTALASTGASVAQGVPFDTALTNATVNAVTSTGSQSVAGYISKLGASPEVANAITSVGASGLATAAKGGSAADIERNMTGALAGSTITGLTGDKLSGAVVGGAVTGGTMGAALGAAGAAGAEAAKPASTSQTQKATDTIVTTAAEEPVTTTATETAVTTQPGVTDQAVIDLTGIGAGNAAVTTDTFTGGVDLGQTGTTDQAGTFTGGVDLGETGTADQAGTFTGGVDLGETGTQDQTGTFTGGVDLGEVGEPDPNDTFTGGVDLGDTGDIIDTGGVDLGETGGDLGDTEEVITQDTTYKPDLFIYGGKTPKAPTTPGRQTTNLGTTLQAPFYPTSTLGQALTGYRGAGEIEGKKSGKPRQNVWNEESLRLKDALGL